MSAQAKDDEMHRMLDVISADSSVESHDEQAVGDDGDDDGDDDDDGGGGGGSDNSWEDGFGSDLIGDAKDRAKLMALPELQREEILLQRTDKRNDAEARRKAQRQFWRAKRSKANSETREHDHDKHNVDEDGINRRDSRRVVKRHKGKANALEDIRARRINKNIGKQLESVQYTTPSKKQKTFSSQRSNTSRESSDDNDDNEVDADYVSGEAFISESDDENVVKRKPKYPRRPEDERPVDFDTIKNLQLRRNNIVKIIDEPFAKEVCVDMFVRIGMGKHASREPRYEICQIQELFPKGSGYKSANIRVGHVSNTRGRGGICTSVFPVDHVSNRTAMPNEAHRWIEAMRHDNLPLPIIADLKQRDLHNKHVKRQFRYTDKMVNAMVQNRGGVINRNSTAANIELKRMLALAEQDGDEDAVAKIKSQMFDVKEALDRRARHAKIDKSVEEHNERVRQQNMLAESGSASRQQHLHHHHHHRDNNNTHDDTPKLDPFKRCRTRPTMSVMHDNKARSLSPPKKRETRIPESEQTPIQIKTVYRADASSDKDEIPIPFAGQSTPALRKVIKAHNVTLNIDIKRALQNNPRVRASFRTTYPNSFQATSRWSDRGAFKNTISLEQWRHRRGLDPA